MDLTKEMHNHVLRINTYLLIAFDLITTRTNHIKSSHIAVFIHKLVINLHILASEHSTRSITETIHVTTDLLHKIENSGNHVMTSGSLTSGKHHSDIDGSPNLILARFIFHTRKSVSVGEKSSDFLYRHYKCQFDIYHGR